MPQDKMRRTLLDRVQMYEFAVIEANLYLDSHPQDQDALNTTTNMPICSSRQRRSMRSSLAL